eukprot:TRINITY_DN11758_c0_g1_i1.p1 TRINITY_DN11758_c0_g1~~TRINITY_DN11758_c0_g1_i1.p1  ORF type:complete len:270 (+),score=43.43 TRINITY_DN11758_c0_g1_i1:143-952(+)
MSARAAPAGVDDAFAGGVLTRSDVAAPVVAAPVRYATANFGGYQAPTTLAAAPPITSMTYATAAPRAPTYTFGAARTYMPSPTYQTAPTEAHYKPQESTYGLPPAAAKAETLSSTAASVYVPAAAKEVTSYTLQSSAYTPSISSAMPAYSLSSSSPVQYSFAQHPASPPRVQFNSVPEKIFYDSMPSIVSQAPVTGSLPSMSSTIAAAPQYTSGTLPPTKAHTTAPQQTAPAAAAAAPGAATAEAEAPAAPARKAPSKPKKKKERRPCC